MDNRAAKLALARRKLKDHQEKKTIQKEDSNLNSDFSLVGKDNSIKSIQESRDHNVDEFVINAHNEETIGIQYAEVVTANNPNNHHDITSHVDSQNIIEDVPIPANHINVTEILISNKRNLELQLNDLQSKLNQMEYNHESVISNFKICNQKVTDLENELHNVNSKYLLSREELLKKESEIKELESIKTSLAEENSNVLEQLEFTKTVLNAKEAESDSLHSQLYNLQNQYDVIHLQLQQLTNGSPSYFPNENAVNNEKNKALLQKIASLEQQLSLMQKERDQMNVHYEHYVAELNEQLKSAIKKNEDLCKEVQNLSNRENSLIEQISDMEIRIQNYNMDKKHFEMDHVTSNMKVLQDNLKQAQDDLSELQLRYQQLQSQYSESAHKVKELSEIKATECNHDNISISKLNADMASDKVAAQRATEQNKKLKQDVQGLEDAFIKMSKDKLELTEKLTAEKYLNRELTIKLSEVEEKAKDMQIKLKAKDEEMIRLQSSYREIEKQQELLHKNTSVTAQEAISEIIKETLENNNVVEVESHEETEHAQLSVEMNDEVNHGLQKEDAMTKLQERFLKIMGEVADLSDEKHRLEHIILQLQNETDTICEYVALYQQQRSLLKRRDEERSAQLKVFQQECGKLKSELEELSGILARFAQDKDLLSYFQVESRRTDMEKVMMLLTNLKNNSLIDPRKKNAEFKNFYPCNCCSGKLIDV